MKPRLKQIFVEAGVQPGQMIQLNAAGTAYAAGLRMTASPSASPGVNNDNTQGYGPGSLWVRLDTDEAWICVDATTGAAIWAELALGGNAYQEQLNPQAITGTDTALTDQLDHTPVSDASVSMYMNGIFQKQGSGEDYTISGTQITWLANSGTAVDMDLTDVLVVKYESLA